MFCSLAMPINVSSKEFIIILALSVAALWSLFNYTREWRNRRSRLLKLGRELSGPPTWPIFGNALMFAVKHEEFLNNIRSIVARYEKSTPIRLWLGPKLHVIITVPSDIMVVLNSQQASQKGNSYRFMFPYVGDGLISGSGKRHKLYRKIFSRVINGGLVRDCVGVVDRRSKILVDKLRVLADGRNIDIHETLQGCTIDIIFEILMGCTDINAQDNPDQDFMRAIRTMYNIFMARVTKIWLHPDFVHKLTHQYEKQCQVVRVIHNFMEKRIAAKRKELSERKIRTDELNNFGHGGNSILERILETNDVSHELTDDEIRDQLFLIYLADTMSVTCCFMTLMLAMHEDVQKKCRQEIQDVLNDGETITTASLGRLKYLEMMVKETLRLFPIAPFTMRRLTSELPLDTCTLPAGCEVVIAAYIVHRSDRYWRNPERFDPERFSSEESSTRHAHAYIPFSCGPMGCIGQHLAMMCLKTIMANLLRSYRITTNVRMEDLKLTFDTAIRSMDGYKVSLEPLSGRSCNS